MILEKDGNHRKESNGNVKNLKTVLEMKISVMGSSVNSIQFGGKMGWGGVYFRTGQ